MVCPALLTPEVEDIEPRPVAAELAERAQLIAAQLATTLPTRGGTLLLLDLEPTLGVSIAAHLNELHLANPVLLLPRWPYVRAVLAVDALLHALTTHAQRLTQTDQPNVVFVVDAQRTVALPGRSASDDRTDNRYRLSPSELPDLAALRARDIQRVVKLAHV
jgi:hypothetical protein